MSKKEKSVSSRRVTMDLPTEYIDIIDDFCTNNLLTRRKWFFDAMRAKLIDDGLLNEQKKEVPQPKSK